jgi:hypothetical protein
MSRVYTAPDGTRYPLREARYDMMFKCYKSDRRKAVQGDPQHCILALGIKRHKDVLAAYVGAGIDAYVVFKSNEDEEAHAVHFGIKTRARKVLDAFDKDRKAESMTIVLAKPPHSWRLDTRSKNNARRRAAIKNGALVKPRTARKKNRMERLGVERRPLAPISKSGNVNVEQTISAAA